MLTWTSVIDSPPTGEEIAAAVACRDALRIRPLIEHAGLRLAMGLPVAGHGAATADVPPTAPAPRKRRPATATAATGPKRAASAKRSAPAKRAAA